MSQGSREVAGSGRSRRRSRSPSADRGDGDGDPPILTVLAGRDRSTTSEPTRGRDVAPPNAAPLADEAGRRTAPAQRTAGSNLVSLAKARILLWAMPRGDRAEFEVSKGVSVALQSRCKTAPRCPGETVDGWLEPQNAPLGICPYAYETRGECVCDRNAEALGAALFGPGEARLVRNYLHALGYNVRDEEVPPLDLGGMRILQAHSKIGDTHDVRVLGVPGVGELVLVRDLGGAAPERSGGPRSPTQS